MKITEHRKRRTGNVYWVLTAETEHEKNWCEGHSLPSSKYNNESGMAFLCKDRGTKDTASAVFAAIPEINTEDNENEGENMSKEEAESMNVQDLRKKAAELAKAKGLNLSLTTIRTKWSKEQLADFIASDGETVPAVADKADKAALLLELLGQLTPEAPPVDEEQIKEWINEAVGIASRKFTFVMPETGTEKDMGIQHKDFDKILTLVKLTQPKVKKELGNMGLDGVCLWGGAGGGKTFLAHAIADALELDFYPCSCHPHMTASQLFGYPTATGGYVESPLYKAFKNGGLFLLDEGDRAPEGIITSLNGATANGFCTFPNGEIVEKHEDFCLILGSNTNLRGNSKMYNSAKRQDGSVLDRYTFFKLEYDEELEKMLSGGNADWYATVKKYRDAAPKVGSDHLITPRATRSGATLLATGIFTWAEVEEMTIWKGLDPDQVRKIKAAC